MALQRGMTLLLLGIGYLLHAELSSAHRSIVMLHVQEEGLHFGEERPHRGKRNASFPKDLPQNVTAIAGQSVVLLCQVENLGNRTVSWIRKRDLHILTSMSTTYTSDARFTVRVVKPNNWNLRIDYVQPRDAGIYECQVSAEPKIYRAVDLRVLDVQAKIAGSEEVYVKKGSTISLICTIDMQDVVPSNVAWYHAGSIIDFDGPRGGVFLETEKGKSFTRSKLLITRALLNDSGNYTCFSNSAAPASVMVHVLNGEHPAAMQHGGTDTINRRIFFLVMLALTITAVR